jgi:hypothetical protein
MSDRPSRRSLGALVVGVALIVVGAVLAAFAVFGGEQDAPAPEPSPTASCNIFDPECGPGPEPTAGPTEPEPSSPPVSTTPPPAPTSEPTTPPDGESGGGTGVLFGGANG